MVFTLLGGFTPFRSSREDTRESGSPPKPVPARRRFATTRWSLVLAAGGKGTPQARKALAQLCELYWFPVYSFVQRRVGSAEKARDLTQAFFARLLEKNALAVATPRRGRFRSWLLTSVQNFLANEWDRENAARREGQRVHIPFEDAEDCLRQDSALGFTPEQAFARRWAEKLLERVLASLHEEFADGGKEALFEVLKTRLTGEEDEAYAPQAEALGMSTGALRVAAFRFRERYRELLLEEIAHTVEDPADVEGELRFLIAALSGV